MTTHARDAHETHDEHPHCETLLALLDGEEDGDRVEALLERHLGECPICASEERTLHDLIVRFCNTSPPPIPPTLEARILARLCG